jgi:hypothetical protein
MPKEAPRETPRPRNYVPHACASDASCPPRLRGAGWAVSGGHTGSCERTPSSELRLLHGSPSRTLGKSAHRHGGLEVDVVRRSVAPGSSLGGHTRQNVERWADRRGGRLPAPVEDRPRSVVIDGLKERERPGWTSSLGYARSTRPAPPSGQPGLGSTRSGRPRRWRQSRRRRRSSRPRPCRAPVRAPPARRAGRPGRRNGARRMREPVAGDDTECRVR